jgi:4-hydroxythreonine-4-phosphate dehydrogenase
VTRNSKPLVVTAGEPAGIGPELCLAIAATQDSPDFIVISDVNLLRERAQQLDIGIQINSLASSEPDAWRPSTGALDVLDVPFPAAVEYGKPDPANARALLEGLRLAAQGCRDGRFSALVTAPLAKNVISDAGIAFTGHTEFLAEMSAVRLPVMLLVAGDMRVALATTHMPLRDVPDALTATGLRDVITILIAGLKSCFGIDAPEILVCGLNPHAGESGHLGHEDRDVIAPIVREFRESGANIRGPIPADTAFTPAAGDHDAILAMYHDQGLPVLKYAGFGHAVNVTLGLPFVRTSVDHGTAFDLAGTGTADTGSMRAAMDLARKIAQRIAEQS